MLHFFGSGVRDERLQTSDISIDPGLSELL